MKLKIAENLSLPIDAATQTLLIFGKRGSGKSSTATRFAEQLIEASVPIAVLDPVDVWWGLKAGKDSRREGGKEVYVFGGAHKDLPLEPTAGALAADTLVEHRIHAVFVLREFSNREKTRFVSDFAERLFARNRAAMHLFCEEAHEVMPQKPYGGEEEMLGRMTRLQKLGRTSGIGLTSITQRPASLNTNARTQAEILIIHRILGPHDRDAIDEWIKFHNVQGERQTVMETIASLKTGEAWVWAPDFPEERPIWLKRVSMLLPETFDSRRTPKPGETVKQPKALAPVDLDKLRDKMAATIEKAKADDPRELRKQIAELRKQLAAQQTVAPNQQIVAQPKVVEKFVLKDGQLARAETIIARLEQLRDRVGDHEDGLHTIAKEIRDAILKTKTATPTVHPPGFPGRGAHPPRSVSDRRPTVVPEPPPAQARRDAGVGRREPAEGPAGDLKAPEQRILDAVAWWESAGVSQPLRHQVAFVARYTVNGHFNNTLGGLRSRGLVDYPAGDRVSLTAEGRALAFAPEDAPTREELIGRVLAVLRTEPQQRIFRAVVQAGPSAMLTREDLADATGYTVNGHFNNTLGSLRSIGVIRYPVGNTVALSELFDALA